MRAHMGLAAAVMVASLAGCASTPGGSANSSAPDMDWIRVRVENHNWADMNVYVENNGMRTRLGTVTTATSRIFTVPRGVVSVSGSVRLIADPIGGAEVYATSPVLVSPGQLVEFTIENRVALSSYSVWD